jgi:hypothetical protein
MPAQSKPKKVGRPKLPKGEAEGKIVAQRFSAEHVKRVSAAEKSSKQSASKWIRCTLNAALEA